jgi:hypothetical protein
LADADKAQGGELRGARVETAANRMWGRCVQW